MISFKDSFLFNDDIAKSLWPIRKILRSNDFYNFIKEDFNPEYLFFINNSFKIKQNSTMVGIGMKRTFEIFQILENIISFLNKGTENEYIKNIYEEMRISIQNFILAMEWKSYYAAACEIRRVLELVLWLDLISNKKSEEEINAFIKKNRIITVSDSYSELFRKKSNELFELWKICCSIVHSKEKIAFNVNIIYKNNVKIVIDQFLQCLSNASYHIFNSLLNFLNVYNENKYLEKFRLLVLKYFEYIKKLTDNIVENDNFVELPDLSLNKNEFKSTKHPQDIMNNLKSMTTTYDDKYKLLYCYNCGLFDYIWKVIDWNENIISNTQILDYQNYKEDISKMSRFLNIEETILYSYCFSWGDIITSLVTENIFINYYYISILIRQLSILFIIEINENSNYKINILRTMVEDYLIMVLNSKKDLYGLINSIYEFCCSEFKIELDNDKWNEIKSMRHVRPTERIKYYSNNKKSFTGEIDKGYENIIFVTDILDLVIDKFVKDMDSFVKNNNDICVNIMIASFKNFIYLYKNYIEKNKNEFKKLYLNVLSKFGIDEEKEKEIIKYLNN